MKGKMWLNWLLLIGLVKTCEFSIVFRDNDDVDDHFQISEYQVANHVASLGVNTVLQFPSIESNVIISPANVYSCLGILELGACGETKDEISRLLGPRNANISINAILDSLNDVKQASAVFIDENSVVKDEFVNSSLTQYQAPVINMNVSDGDGSSYLINSWVSEHTNGTIPELIQGSLDPDTKAVVVSALFFKGKWLYPFSPSATLMGKFLLNDNSTIPVPFMHLEATLPLFRSSHFDAIGLPYQDNDLMLYLILPRQTGLDALKEAFSQLGPNDLHQLRQNCIPEPIMAIVPKFKVDVKLRLKDSLKQQGLISMFNPSTANFTNLIETSNSPLFVSEIFHNVHFEINEEGTVASAVSAAVFTKSSKYAFRASRPFVFVVMHKTGLVLFTGIITKPQNE